jgi:hypothetical protein
MFEFESQDPTEQAAVTAKCYNHSCCLTIFRKWAIRLLILRDDGSAATVFNLVSSVWE